MNIPIRNQWQPRHSRTAGFLGVFIGCLALARTSLGSASEPLTLERYLFQVTESNQGYRGDVLGSAGAMSASREADLPFVPQLYLNPLHTDDRRPTAAPVFEGTRTLTDSVAFGVRKLTGFGLQADFSYNVQRQTIYGVSPSLIPQPSLVTTGFQLRLTQPVWQGGFGKLDQSSKRAVEAQGKSASFTDAYNAETTLADAESRYWRLSVARESVRIQNESMDRNAAIRDYNAKRVRSHLIDEADLLQSEAAVQSKKLDLKSVLDDERTVARAFNSARGIDSDEVSETLVVPDPAFLRGLEIPARSEKRDDVKAAEQSTIAVVANSEAARERQLPVFNLVGVASTNGLDPGFGSSASHAFTTQYPYYQFGFNFSIPLDSGTLSSVRAAYAQQARAAELIYQRRLFDQESDWKDLVKRFKEAKERLDISVNLQNAQRVKVESERRRLKQGLTTTYQVFLFEQDYINAELSRVRIEGAILDLLAQMKTYRGEP